jgi:hypothetical protein
MKFAIANEHRKFFQKNGWIEFDDLLSADQLAIMNREIDQVLATRLDTSPGNLKTFSSEQIFLKGHDLWRSSPSLSQCTLFPRFGEIATELIEKKPLRIGYDQLYPPSNTISTLPASTYDSFLSRESSLDSMCCLTDVACGLIFALGESPSVVDGSDVAEAKSIFPGTQGHAVFFLPSLNIQWDAIGSSPQQRYYLIVYTRLSSRYVLQPADPHTHALKQLGYIFNDKLNDRHHPIVYR